MASRLQDAIQRGTRAAQPLATAVSAGTIYYVTDESVTERSSGSAWQSISDAGTAGITALTGDVTATGPGSVAATIANNAVSNAKLRDSAALSVIGRSANSGGDPADIAAVAASASVLRESGSTVGFGTVATAGIADDAITDAKIRESAALSVIGRSANSTGNPADIAATPATDAVLRESGSTVGFGTVVAGGIAANAVITAKILDKNVTYAKIQDVTNARLLGNFTGGAAAPAEYSLGAGLEHSAGAIRLKSSVRTDQIGITVDGGGSLITIGDKGFKSFPVAGTITAWRLMGDASGDIDFDVTKDVFASFPPTTSILTPDLSGVQTHEVTGLSIAVAAGDVFGFEVTGTPITVTRVTLEITIEVTG